MYGFLVEFRLHGYPKKYAKRIIRDVSKRYRVKGVTRKKVVPHVTLFGPAKTHDIGRVIAEIEKVGRRYTIVPFNLKGFGYFSKGSKVIYLNIEPSEELEQLRWELSQRLSAISKPQTWDLQRKFGFHATVAFKDIDRKFEQIWKYIQTKEEPNLNQYLLRITVVGTHRRIVCEYDLVLKRLLNRQQALSGYWWRRSMNQLKQVQDSRYKHRSILGRFIQFFNI